MSDRIRIACVQLTSRNVKADNIDKAAELVARAASLGADLVVLPERWNLIGSTEETLAGAETIERGESVAAMASWARGHGVAIVGGSIGEQREGGGRAANTCLVFDRDGSLVAAYRKIHLFDVEAGGHVYRESEGTEAGDEPVVADAAGWRIGLSVCYDIRFPELYRALALEGAELLTAPAHFTTHTGKDHWELLQRARAVENGCYVASAAQVGVTLADKPASYGRSLIVDPWGTVVATAPDEETVIVAEASRARIAVVRAKLPSLAPRRPEAYAVRAPVA
jgi:predicted amidohydrolase